MKYIIYIDIKYLYIKYREIFLLSIYPIIPSVCIYKYTYVISYIQSVVI